MNKKRKNKEVQLVVFKLGDEEFGVDITQVKEIMKMTQITKIPCALSFVEGLINLRGKVTAVVDLRKKLNIKTDQQKNAKIIIVEIDGNTLGMIVDSVIGVLRLSDVEIEPVPSLMTHQNLGYIWGIGKLKERLLILLDLQKILSQKEVKEIKTNVLQYSPS